MRTDTGTPLRSWMAGVIYVLVALLWPVPDRRIARVVNEHESSR